MTQTLRWYGPQVKAKARRGAARGLYLWAEHVLEEATRIVPLAPSGGTLERSGVASVDEAALRAATSYDTPYAVRQHEELEWQHAPGRQAKYLETPLNASKPKGFAIVAREVKAALR